MMSFSYVGGRQWGYACTDETYCVYYGNPSLGGYRNFDNILSTWLQVLQHMAPCNWDYIMYSTQGAMSWWTWLLHIPMAFFGIYLLMNLTIATLVISFNKAYTKMNMMKEMSAGKNLRARFIENDFFQESAQVPLKSPGRFWSIRIFCKRIQASRTFEIFIITIILLNVVALSIVW